MKLPPEKLFWHSCWLSPLIIIMIMCCAPSSSWGFSFGGGTTLPVDNLVITPGPMKAPMRIAAVGDGQYLVSDYQARKIILYDPLQTEQTSEAFAVSGTPLAIEVMRKFVLIGNDLAGTIELYKPDGKLLKLFTTAGPLQASDMVYDSMSRLLFVADSLNRDVKVFRESGELLLSFGMLGPLVRPTGIAIDPQTQQVFVTDYGDSKAVDPTARLASLQVYSYEGALLAKVTGNFSRPQGVAVDTNRVFLVDAMLGKVLVLDRSNGYAQLATLGTFGVAEGELFLPMDVHFDAANARLLVTNSRLGKVTLFDVAEPSP